MVTLAVKRDKNECSPLLDFWILNREISLSKVNDNTKRQASHNSYEGFSCNSILHHISIIPRKHITPFQS